MHFPLRGEGVQDVICGVGIGRKSAMVREQ
jgi:hypothetical protein